MFIECYKNNGTDYLRLVRSVRRPKKSDPSVFSSYKVTELNIGPLSRFDDGKPDYVRRLKQSFRDGDPLIPALRPYVDEAAVPKREGLPADTSLFKTSFAHPRYAATILLDRIFQKRHDLRRPFQMTGAANTNLNKDHIYTFASTASSKNSFTVSGDTE